MCKYMYTRCVNTSCPSLPPDPNSAQLEEDVQEILGRIPNKDEPLGSETGVGLNMTLVVCFEIYLCQHMGMSENGVYPQ